MGGRVPVRALVVVALLGAAAALAAAAAPGREDFERGRRLVEDNCGDCMGGTRQGLEDGVAALRRAFDAGYSEPAAVYRLLADAYATLAYAYAKTDPNALPRFEALRREVLQRLAALTPDDPWPRYELAVIEPDRDSQLAALRRLLAERPRYADAYFAVATILEERGRRAEAILEMEQAVAAAGPGAIDVYRRRLAEMRRQAGERCDTYRGRAVRGTPFEQPIGDGLVFRLTPDAWGWTIGVISAGRPAEDFAGIATPPYRGINPRYLEGWHFRNQANTGPNDGDVNAPQHEREFSFVLTPESYRRAATALDALLWGARPEEERERAYETLQEASRGRGLLRITDSTLGNLVPGAQAWFESMTFDVELCRPGASPG
jgi:hypothetical protein